MAQNETGKTALIIGASRGLGHGLAAEYLSRGWHVIATERKVGASKGLAELASKAGDSLQIEAIDITEPAQISALHNRLKSKKIDLLFVNAGVIDDTRPINEVTTEDFIRLMVTNALSPMRVIESLSDLVKENGTIAVMSSGLGSVENNNQGGYEAYRASKAALNTLMRSYASRAGQSRSLMAVAPGWVRTDMGGSQAPLDIKTSVSGIVDTIAAHAEKPGMVYVDYRNETIPW